MFRKACCQGKTQFSLSHPCITNQCLHSCAYTRARICKRLRSPGIYSKESIPPAYIAWRAGASNSVVVPARQAGNRFLGSAPRLLGRIDSGSGSSGIKDRVQLGTNQEEKQRLWGEKGKMKTEYRRGQGKKREGIFKLLRNLGIDSKESNPPAYVAWRAGTTTLFLLGSQPPQVDLKSQHQEKARNKRV